MIKDIVVNLPLRAEKDRTTAFAASLAGYFGAHVTGIAFMYWPLFVCVQMGAAEAQFIKKHDAAAKEAADAAVDRLAFEIRRESVSWNSHQISVPVDEAPGRFAEIARAFDIAVVSQAEPENGAIDDLIAQAVLFQSGHPTLVVPYIQTASLGWTALQYCGMAVCRQPAPLSEQCHFCIVRRRSISYRSWGNVICGKNWVVPTCASIFLVTD